MLNTEAFKSSDHFHNFYAACRWLVDDCEEVDPVPLDMALAKVPPELQNAALLYAYEYSITELHSEMLNYVKSKGIEQLFPGVFLDYGYAADIRYRYFYEKDRVPSGHIEILQQAAAHHRLAFTLSSVDELMKKVDSNTKLIGSAYFRRLSTHLLDLSSFCEPESLKDLLVGNRVIQRFVGILDGKGVVDGSEVVNALAVAEQGFKFDDVGALSALLKSNFISDSTALQQPLKKCLADILGKPLDSQGVDFLVAMLKARPKSLLEKLVSLDDKAFSEVSRGIFLDEYLTCGWMSRYSGGVQHDLGDVSLIDLIDRFNARALADPINLSKLKSHGAIWDPQFTGVESLILLPRLKAVGMEVFSRKRIEELAALIKVAHPFSHLEPYCQSALEGCREHLSLHANRLYDQLAETKHGKDFPDPSSMSMGQKFDYLAIRLSCEIEVSEEDAEQAFKHPETPIVNFTEGEASDRSLDSRDLWLPTLFTEVARTLSEETILNAIGDRVTHFRHLIEHDILDRKHLARLPLKEQGGYFSKDLGL